MRDVRVYLGVGAAAGDGVVAVAVGGFGRHPLVFGGLAGLLLWGWFVLVFWCCGIGVGVDLGKGWGVYRERTITALLTGVIHVL